ncbi:hypothetical protein BGX21_004260 [Mortierella sp. AD011]|nr:hypothetical protein BGX20_004191 [Mortierella sp. AD010]KAF9374021.1 hypothetical protein BGX21_004260 [Mortierella sp. AD011]
MSSIDRDHPIDLPEIFSLISSHLSSPSDLANACRVNKTWHGPFTSQLYHTIKRDYWDTERHERESGKTQNKNIALMKALNLHANFIREFSCPNELDLDEIQSFPELTLLTSYEGPEVNIQNMDQQISILEMNSVSLEKITVEWHNPRLSDSLIKTLSGLKKLCSLDLTAVLIPKNTVEHILESLPALTHLGINDLDISESSRGSILTSDIEFLQRPTFSDPGLALVPSSVSSRKSSYRLKSLSFAIYEGTRFSVDLLLHILAVSPSLVRLEFTERCKDDSLSEESESLDSFIDALHDQPKYPEIKDLILNSERIELGYLLCRQYPEWPKWSIFLPEYHPLPSYHQFLSLRTLHLTADEGSGSEVAIIAIWAGRSVLSGSLEDLKIIDNDGSEDISPRVSGHIVNILCNFTNLRSVILNKVMIQAADLFVEGKFDEHYEAKSEDESEAEFDSESESDVSVRDKDDKDVTHVNCSAKERSGVAIADLEKRDKMLKIMRTWGCKSCLKHLEILISGIDSSWSPHSIACWDEFNARSQREIAEVAEYKYVLDGSLYDHVRAFLASMPQLNQSRIGYTWD